jgi:hypothetical protein
VYVTLSGKMGGTVLGDCRFFHKIVLALACEVVLLNFRLLRMSPKIKGNKNLTHRFFFLGYIIAREVSTLS